MWQGWLDARSTYGPQTRMMDGHVRCSDHAPPIVKATKKSCVSTQLDHRCAGHLRAAICIYTINIVTKTLLKTVTTSPSKVQF